ncbi:flavodoxin family protein [Methanospirillum lacunae]|uniref:Flavodoxin family protein n=1 Tax=Methanospirillum lacunae TaxID=668570 RepID=A0A2V2MSY2_9EURY|nr:flavodoxin family protein [Methanospirillum lacunae]PWR70519.1 flavodoxin family protein [Methanospirillum lacunae]
MKVVAFSASPRKKGNSELMIRVVFGVLEEEGIETELVRIGCNPLQGCKACNQCYENQDKECIIGLDSFNEFVQKMIEADGIILASPMYFADVTAEMKAFIDRCGMIGKANGDLFQRKVGVAVVSMRRGGGIHAFDTINHFFLTSQMIIPGSSYWNVGLGGGPGEVEDDEEGLAAMELLGHNMAWLLKKIHS